MKKPPMRTWEIKPTDKSYKPFLKKINNHKLSALNQMGNKVIKPIKIFTTNN